MRERERMMRLGLIFIAWFIAMHVAIKYGGIWNSQANPTPNVTVTLRNGQLLEGTLWRGWDNSLQLEVSPGATPVRFDDDGYMAMSFQPNGIRPPMAHWRAWAPVIAVCWTCLIAIVWPAAGRWFKG